MTGLTSSCYALLTKAPETDLTEEVSNILTSSALLFLSFSPIFLFLSLNEEKRYRKKVRFSWIELFDGETEAKVLQCIEWGGKVTAHT